MGYLTPKDLKEKKMVAILCPQCFTWHGVPIPKKPEEYGGVDLFCGCGKNMVYVTGEMELIESGQ